MAKNKESNIFQRFKSFYKENHGWCKKCAQLGNKKYNSTFYVIKEFIKSEREIKKILKKLENTDESIRTIKGVKK